MRIVCGEKGRGGQKTPLNFFIQAKRVERNPDVKDRETCFRGLNGAGCFESQGYSTTGSESMTDSIMQGCRQVKGVTCICLLVNQRKKITTTASTTITTRPHPT